MREKTLILKMLPKETVALICICAYAVYHYGLSPIFAQISDFQPVTKAPAAPSQTDMSFPEDAEWRSLKTFYFTVYYKPDADLKAIERRLRLRGEFYIPGISKPAASGGAEEKIALRVDYLFRRVKEILDMRPRVENVKIKIFRNRKEMNGEYAKIFGEKMDLKSFYIYKYNTIYTNEDDISDSVIAHEMGHVIVDHYFTVRPPEKVREILSQYIDLHLDD